MQINNKMQNNPVAMKLKIETDKLQQQAQKDKAQFEVDMQKIVLEKEKIAADMMINEQHAAVQLVRAQTERLDS